MVHWWALGSVSGQHLAPAMTENRTASWPVTRDRTAIAPAKPKDFWSYCYYFVLFLSTPFPTCSSWRSRVSGREDEKSQDREWPNRSYPLPWCLEPGAPWTGGGERLWIRCDIKLLIYAGIYGSKTRGVWWDVFSKTEPFGTWKWVLNNETVIMNESNPKPMTFVWGVRWWRRESVCAGG